MPGARGAWPGRYDRAYLLGDAKRNDVLTLDEVERYGSDSFGDPGYVAVYGLKPREWYARGVRLLARTAVECTRDALADRMAGDLAAAVSPGRCVVVDPFAGSANTLFWLARRLGAHRAVGLELDRAVFDATRRNLAIVGFAAELHYGGYEATVGAVDVPVDEQIVVFVAPPWGRALAAERGLDLRLTQPPVPVILDFLARAFARHAVIVAIQIHETVLEDSLAEVRGLCAWSRPVIYDINIPGQNHGVLLGGLPTST